MNQDNIIEGEALCKECGLCCKGIFHPYAILYTEQDISIAKNANIPIRFDKDDNRHVFALPCPVFDGKCSIYPDRPSVCPKHKCGLLEGVIHGTKTLENAQEKVESIKNILILLLPKLKRISHDIENSYPRDLIKKIFENLKDKQAREEFKQTHKKMLVEYGIFCILEEKYFYKKSGLLL